mgnify:CR=1 FL=1
MRTIKSEVRPNLKKCRGLLSLISDPRSSRLQDSNRADNPIPVSSINNLVSSIALAKSGEQPRQVNTYSANKGVAHT